MHILVTHGSKMGGTAGIAEQVGQALADARFQADVRPASEGDHLDGYNAVFVGGALYAGRWHRDARWFVKRHTGALRERPVWLFSSGPLNGSAIEAIPRYRRCGSCSGGSAPAARSPSVAASPPTPRGSRPARWPRPTPATGAIPSGFGLGGRGGDGADVA
jgi:hypothetical protein